MVRDFEVSLNDNHRTNTKVKIWVYSLKRNGLAILFCIFTICLVIFSKANLVASKDGLILWATAVVPSLFPFFVATEMLSNTCVVSYLGKFLTPIMRPLFGIPGEGAFAFIMGLISGYPVGAKIVSNFMEQGICTKEEAQRMLAFTNNSGPLFIIGTVGITLFGNTTIGILLYITHILACISVGIILKIFASKNYNKNFVNSKNIPNKYYSTSGLKGGKSNMNSNPSFSSLGEILGNSIKSATSTVLMIGGFVVIFSVIISILNQSNILFALSNMLSPIFSVIGIPSQLVAPLLSGIVELTNGVSLIANTPIKNICINIVLCAFLLGFGGFSILLQVFSIACKSGLSIKKYVIGKFLQGVLAAIYTLIALQFIPFLNFNL